MKFNTSTNPQVYKWLRSRLSPEEGKAIEEAIKKAEQKTSGEIVPLIVRRSSTIGHVPLCLLLLLTNMSLILEGGIQFYTQSPLLLSSPLFMLGALVTLLLLTRILSPLEWVQRILTPRQDQALQVNQRAEIEFFEAHMGETQAATGILLMLSLMEHRAVVLADKAINDKLPPDTWHQVIGEMTYGIKSQNISQGMIAGIHRCGELLAQHFPLPPNDTNELSNQLIIKN